MAKNTNKRTMRREKNDRCMNRALELLTAGFLGEFYLLMVNNYFVKGSIEQLVAMSYVLEVLVYVGLALVAAGVALLIVNKKKEQGFTALNKWLLISGVFFTLSSQLMLKIYPQGTTFMCILVPVIMVLGIVFLMYQHEFSVQTAALSLSILATVLLNRGAGKTNWTLIVKGYSVFAVFAVLALQILVLMAQRNDGCVKTLLLFPSKTDYKLTYAVLVVCVLVILAALFVGNAAFYGTWVLSILLFVLAVYYTVKML